MWSFLTLNATSFFLFYPLFAFFISNNFYQEWYKVVFFYLDFFPNEEDKKWFSCIKDIHNSSIISPNYFNFCLKYDSVTYVLSTYKKWMFKGFINIITNHTRYYLNITLINFIILFLFKNKKTFFYVLVCCIWYSYFASFITQHVHVPDRLFLQILDSRYNYLGSVLLHVVMGI